MGRLSSSVRSINEAESITSAAAARVFASAVAPKDSSEMESASIGCGKRIVSRVSADRMLGRDARPVWERRGASPGREGGVMDCHEGVSPNNWVNLRDFLTSSARSCGRRLFVVGGRSSRKSEKLGLSTAVTGAEMEVERAWDDRRNSASAVVPSKGDFPRGG